MTRKAWQQAILDHQAQLEGARADARRIVLEGMLRAFPDLRLPRNGHCRRCQHQWRLHDLPLWRREPGRRYLPCACCDRHV